MPAPSIPAATGAAGPAAGSLAKQPRSMRMASGYQPVHQGDDADSSLDQEQKGDDLAAAAAFIAHESHRQRRFRLATYLLSVCLVILVASNLYTSLPYTFGHREPCPCRPSKVPQYFQTWPELWPGPTATGKPAFMAQTRTFDPTATYVPNEPLQTSIPVEGMGPANQSIFKMMGFLSPYFASPGFGVDEFPLPPGADIVQVQMLSRHGARYPTSGSDAARLGEKFANASREARHKGPLAFLNDWKYQLGYEILVPKGREELFESGELAAPSCRDASFQLAANSRPRRFAQLHVREPVQSQEQTHCADNGKPLLVRRRLGPGPRSADAGSQDAGSHAQVCRKLDGRLLWARMVRLFA